MHQSNHTEWRSVSPKARKMKCLPFSLLTAGLVVQAYLSPLHLSPTVPYSYVSHSIHGRRPAFQPLCNSFPKYFCTPLFMTDESMYYEEQPSIGMSSKRRPLRLGVLQEKRHTQLRLKQVQQEQQQIIAQTDPTLLSNTSFALIPEIHSSTKRALMEHLGFQTMTEIQAQAFYPIVSGSDVIGRARTGTGKTIAYLVPSLERLFQLQAMNLFRPDRDVGILILSPVRELASQISDQIETLLMYHSLPSSSSSQNHHPRISIQVVSGATSLARDVAEMNQRIPSILVATPGRLLDHLEQTRLNGRHFGRDVMKNTFIVILDEADRLMSMGFQKDVEKILSFLPRREKRQTLLFSATIPKALRNIVNSTLRDEFIEVDCVGRGGETNIQVEQSHIVLKSVDDYVTSIMHIIHHFVKKEKNQYKIVVFFPTARLVSYFAQLFQLAFGIPVLEIHSKKSPGHRHRVYDTFRSSKQGLLFTSDVSSRGMDYPDVTRVIQFGLPESREQYIHRLGRTARAGNLGSGLLVLSPFESLFLQQLKGLDVNLNAEIESVLQTPSMDVNACLDQAFHRIQQGDAIMQSLAEQAYQSFLGYYVDKMKTAKFRSKECLVQAANQISLLMGLPNVPHLSKDVVHKMGLTGIYGIILAREMENRHVHDRDGKVEHEDGRHRLG